MAQGIEISIVISSRMTKKMTSIYVLLGKGYITPMKEKRKERLLDVSIKTILLAKIVNLRSGVQEAKREGLSSVI
jgi:hypothetical protein